MPNYPDNNPKTATGLTKPRMSLTPSTALVHLSLAFADGAAKYGPYNWREKTVSSTVYVDAMLRHIADWFDGEDAAPDSKVHHLAHVMACCAIIIDAETVNNLNDDRPPKAPTADLIREKTKLPGTERASMEAGCDNIKGCDPTVQLAVSRFADRLRVDLEKAVAPTVEAMKDFVSLSATETAAMHGIVVPFGSFNNDGMWFFNHRVDASEGDQRAYMVRTGQICGACGHAPRSCQCDPIVWPKVTLGPVTDGGS